MKAQPPVSESDASANAVPTNSEIAERSSVTLAAPIILAAAQTGKLPSMIIPTVIA